MVLTPGGNVRWRTNLPRPVMALETDPLGRFFVYGHATGEIVRLDLEPARQDTIVRTTTAVAAARSIRQPDWANPVVKSDTQAETAVLAVLDDPPRIGLLTSGNRLQVFTCAGQNLGFAPEVQGVGRILRTAPGWIASATDRQVSVYDARRNVATRIDLSLAELTHLAIRPDSFGLAIVQERDRVGRATLAGRWVWKKELRSAVEDLAIGPDGYSAVTQEDGRLDIYDPGGGPSGGFVVDPTEPLCLIEAPESSPDAVTWLTLARRAQILRGHDLNGRILWEASTPWEGWQLQRLGPLAVVSAPDGRALIYDGAGKLLAQDRAHEGGSVVFGHSAHGTPWRVASQGVHLICSELSGNVLWRHVADEPFGPLAAGIPGVAVLIGRSLAWFKAGVS